MYTVIAVEDEMWGRKTIQRLCKSIPDVNLAGVFEYPDEALAYADCNDFDIAIIDIVLPVLSGLELGDMLAQKKKGLKIIYISAEDSYEDEITDQSGTAFLNKPLSGEKLRKQMDLQGYEQ